jgi:chromosome segregation ATPase
MLSKVSDFRGTIKRQSGLYTQCKQQMEEEVNRVAREEKRAVEESMEKLAKEEERLQRRMQRLDEKLRNAYEKDVQFKSRSDAFDETQLKRTRLIRDLTDAYTGAQRQIMRSSEARDDKVKKLGELKNNMEDCMKCDEEYNTMMTMLQSTLSSVKLLK